MYICTVKLTAVHLVFSQLKLFCKYTLWYLKLKLFISGKGHNFG